MRGCSDRSNPFDDGGATRLVMNETLPTTEGISPRLAEIRGQLKLLSDYL
jgi:hypothetical protein